MNSSVFSRAKNACKTFQGNHCGVIFQSAASALTRDSLPSASVIRVRPSNSIARSVTVTRHARVTHDGITRAE